MARPAGPIMRSPGGRGLYPCTECKTRRQRRRLRPRLPETPVRPRDISSRATHGYADRHQRRRLLTRRFRELQIWQFHAVELKIIDAQFRRRLKAAATFECDQVVLLDTVTGNTEGTDELHHAVEVSLV